MPFESFAHGDCFRKHYRKAFVQKEQINMHTSYAWAFDSVNQSFVCYLIKYTLAPDGARLLTSSGNVSISFM